LLANLKTRNLIRQGLLVPKPSGRQKTDSTAGADDFEFRPLTDEEKQEFVNSLDAKGKQILAELAPEAKRFK